MCQQLVDSLKLSRTGSILPNMIGGDNVKVNINKVQANQIAICPADKFGI